MYLFQISLRFEIKTSHEFDYKNNQRDQRYKISNNQPVSFEDLKSIFFMLCKQQSPVHSLVL